MYDLNRFIIAQERDYDQALHEIRSGQKRTHWMWYIFPQVKGLGRSEMARYYGIDGLDEAKAYIAHPVLGRRLMEVSQALLNIETGNISDVMEYPDDLKLRSSMTLFAEVMPGEPVFEGVLDKFFGGVRDNLTLQMLGRQEPNQK